MSGARGTKMASVADVSTRPEAGGGARQAALCCLRTVASILAVVLLAAAAQPVPAQDTGARQAPAFAAPAPPAADAAAANDTAAQEEAPAAAPAANPNRAAPEAPPGTAVTAADAAQPQPRAPTMDRALLPANLSPWGMFLDADIVVKVVIIGLAFASLVTWTVFVAKSLELRGARRQVRAGLRALAATPTLGNAHEQQDGKTGAVAELIKAARQEIKLSANLRADGLKERIAWRLERLELASSRKISRGTGVLATIGATAPFVGLFGTVWGIMNSFIGISNAHTTNLAVVAPGIAQALLATALGLIAAIPAVMIYNVLARSTAHYRALLGDASAEVMRLVSRDLDRAKLTLSTAAE
jgi:biopolymer transport protein ExbB